MYPRHAFFNDAASFCIEHLGVFAPKQRLSEARRGGVIEPNQLGCRNHHGIGVPILFHCHEESFADVWPGRAKKVAASGNGVGASRHLTQRNHAAGCGIDLHTMSITSKVGCHRSAPLPHRGNRDVWQKADAYLYRLLGLRGTQSRAERIPLASGKLRQANVDSGFTWNVCVIPNAADPLNTPQEVVIRKVVNCVNAFAHWPMITQSESSRPKR